MRIYCAICSDLFDGFRKISTTRCGHIFHNTCLYRWLDQSNSCPQCRQDSNRRQLVKLYFNLHQREREMSVAYLENNYHDLQAQMVEKDQEIETEKDNFKTLADLYKVMEVAAIDYKKKVMASECREKFLKLKLKEMYQKIEQLKIYEEKNKDLENKIEEFEREIASLNDSKQELKNKVIALKKEIDSKSCKISGQIFEKTRLEDLDEMQGQEEDAETETQVQILPIICVEKLQLESPKEGIRKRPLVKETWKTPVSQDVPCKRSRMNTTVSLKKREKLPETCTRIHTRSFSMSIKLQKKPVDDLYITNNRRRIAETPNVKMMRPRKKQKRV